MSDQLACPNCKQPSFSAWRKQLMGPGRTISCRRCGARVSVSKIHSIPALLVVAAFPIVAIAALLEYGIAVTGGVIIFILLIAGLYQHYFVPLVVRSKPTID